MRTLIQRRLEYRQGFVAAYVDLKKAFDSVDRGSLWELLRRRGVPSRVLDLIAALYTDTESAVKFGGGTSRFFPVKSGVRQGCVLAPSLFNTCMDRVMDGVVADGQCGISIGGSTINDLDFADDVVIFAETLELLGGALEVLSGECSPLGLQVSWIKTKIQVFGDLLGEDRPPVVVDGSNVDFTDSFCYLGGMISSSGGSEQDVNRRLGLANAVVTSLDRSIWSSRYLRRGTKVRLFRALVVPVLLYGSETWTLTVALERRLNSFCTRTLRRIMGYRWDDFVPNVRLLREAGMSATTVAITKRQLRLLGHVARFPESDPVRKILSEEVDNEWRRPPGRPRLTWLATAGNHARGVGSPGLVSAMAEARRNPRAWRQRVAAVMR